MRRLLSMFAIACALVVAVPAWCKASAKPAAAPEVVIVIDISRQSMKVDVDGWPYGRWKVSTAGEGYRTPRGTWRPFLLKEMHYSKKYDNSPMPHSIFFLGGYAIHATYDIKHLGKPASHGCVRLHPRNAERLYKLVEKHGLQTTRIIITE